MEAPSLFKSTRKKRLFLHKKLPLRIYTSRSRTKTNTIPSEPARAPEIKPPTVHVPQTMTPARLMFGMELDEYEAKSHSKRFKTIPWDIDRVAKPEVEEEEVKDKDEKDKDGKKKEKKSFAERIKRDINRYTIGMMGLEMEMRLRVEGERVRVG